MSYHIKRHKLKADSVIVNLYTVFKTNGKAYEVFHEGDVVYTDAYTRIFTLDDWIIYETMCE